MTHNNKRSPWINIALFSITVIAVFVLGWFVSTISERRAEALFAYKPKVKLADFESRNEVWGKNYPWQYESYRKTQETDFKTPHGGNAMKDVLEENPEMVVMWAGYAFSKDYNQGRGHSYAIDDVRNTLRTAAPKGRTIASTQYLLGLQKPGCAPHDEPAWRWELSIPANGKIRRRNREPYRLCQLPQSRNDGSGRYAACAD